MAAKPAPLNWQEHQLVEGAEVPTCGVCGRTWTKGHPDTANCPGLPVHAWGQNVAGFFTKRQLDEKRLKAGPPRALLPYSEATDGYLRLYLESEAKPKKPLTEKQQAAIKKMHAANEDAMRCGRCGIFVGRKHTICGHCEDQERHESAIADVQEAARALLERDFVVVDTETTGLGPDARIVQIAIIDREGAVILDTLINPECPIPADAARIHGITDEAVASAPTFAEAHPAIYAALNGRAWAVYNISFDTGMLNADCLRVGLPMPVRDKVASVDVMLLYAAWCGDWSRYHGDYRWQPLPDGDHTALGDARATLDLIKHMAKESEEIE